MKIEAKMTGTGQDPAEDAKPVQDPVAEDAKPAGSEWELPSKIADRLAAERVQDFFKPFPHEDPFGVKKFLNDNYGSNVWGTEKRKPLRRKEKKLMIICHFWAKKRVPKSTH